eukprot:EG_transcript_1369
MDPIAAVPRAVHVNVIELFQPGPQKVAIVDPTLKHCGLLWVPREHVSPSKALKRITGQEQMPPSLCLLFQKGQCRADQRCNQLHVSPDFIRALRGAMADVPYSNCCIGHGDLPSLRREFQTLLAAVAVVLARNGAPDVTLPPTSVALTVFWRPFIDQQARAENGVMRFSAARVCRLHQRGECKFGVDCNNIHVCREFWTGQRRPCDASLAPAISVSGAAPPLEAGSPRRLSLSSRSSLSAASLADDPLGPRPLSPNLRSPPPAQPAPPPPPGLMAWPPAALQLRPLAPTPGLWVGDPQQPLCYLCIPVLTPRSAAAPATPYRPLAAPAVDALLPSPVYAPVSVSGMAGPGAFLPAPQPCVRPRTPRLPLQAPVHVRPATPHFSPLDGLLPPALPPPRPLSAAKGPAGDSPDALSSPPKLKRSDLHRVFPPPPAVAAVPPCPPMPLRPMGTSAKGDITPRVAAGPPGDEAAGSSEQRAMLAALPAALLADL